MQNKQRQKIKISKNETGNSKCIIISIKIMTNKVKRKNLTDLDINSVTKTSPQN